MNPLLEGLDRPVRAAAVRRDRDRCISRRPSRRRCARRGRTSTPSPATRSRRPSPTPSRRWSAPSGASIGWRRCSSTSPARTPTTAIEALQRDLSPKLAAHHAETMMNAALFARIDDLVARRADLGLDAEQERVLTLYHRMFVRAGARLEGAERARLKEILQRLASLGTAFGQNVLADEQDWTLPLAADDLVGLPEDLVAAAAAAAAERGRDGHVLTLSRSLIVPFLQSSPRRDLRETAFRAWVARGRERRRHRQPRGGRRDAGAARGAGAAARLPGLRLLQAGAGDGEDARGGARPPAGGLGAGAGAGRGGCRAAGGADARRRDQRPARALGLALLRGDPPGARARLRRGGAEALPAARRRARGRVRRGRAALRAELPPVRRARSTTPTPAPGRCGAATATWGSSSATISPAPRSAPAPGAPRSAGRTGSTARCGRSRSTSATSPRRRRARRAC